MSSFFFQLVSVTLGQSVDGRIILKWWDGEAWTGLIWLRMGTACECRNEASSSLMQEVS